MEHIIEVANNVDKTPTFITELKQNKNQRRSYKDITDSSNHELGHITPLLKTIIMVPHFTLE